MLAASGSERDFLTLAKELLASPQRMHREAALAALAERASPDARDMLRELYDHLDADGLKRDQGAAQRVAIVGILRALGDVRDAEIGERAADTVESAFGEDISWQLRAHGLMLLAEIAPDLFPYYAAEHLADADDLHGEPANTVFQLLAGTANFLPIYQWLLTSSRDSPNLAQVLELFAQAPPRIVERATRRTLSDAIARSDDALCIVLAEAIVRLELSSVYPSLGEMMAAKISDELYVYLAMLLASTNRTPLLAILEHELHRGRRPRAVADALRLRTTPEQAAILKRWDEDE